MNVLITNMHKTLSCYNPLSTLFKLNYDLIFLPVEAIQDLKNYSLVVAMVDGRVEHVCPDPDDQQWSVNQKKSIPAQLQNSLPSFTTAMEGDAMTFTEVGHIVQ